jgi:hypothetical protein
VVLLSQQAIFCPARVMVDLEFAELVHAVAAGGCGLPRAGDQLAWLCK